MGSSGIYLSGQCSTDWHSIYTIQFAKQTCIFLQIFLLFLHEVFMAWDQEPGFGCVAKSLLSKSPILVATHCHNNCVLGDTPCGKAATTRVKRNFLCWQQGLIDSPLGHSLQSGQYAVTKV